MFLFTSFDFSLTYCELGISMFDLKLTVLNGITLLSSGGEGKLTTMQAPSLRMHSVLGVTKSSDQSSIGMAMTESIPIAGSISSLGSITETITLSV